MNFALESNRWHFSFDTQPTNSHTSSEHIKQRTIVWQSDQSSVFQRWRTTGWQRDDGSQAVVGDHSGRRPDQREPTAVQDMLFGRNPSGVPSVRSSVGLQWVRPTTHRLSCLSATNQRLCPNILPIGRQWKTSIIGDSITINVCHWSQVLQYIDISWFIYLSHQTFGTRDGQRLVWKEIKVSPCSNSHRFRLWQSEIMSEI